MLAAGKDKTQGRGGGAEAGCKFPCPEITVVEEGEWKDSSSLLGGPQGADMWSSRGYSPSSGNLLSPDSNSLSAGSESSDRHGSPTSSLASDVDMLMRHSAGAPLDTHGESRSAAALAAAAAAEKSRYLPPCRVCAMPASGFHYGVNTCEACKGFFRRALGRQSPYKCPKEDSCDVSKGARNVCPACRYAKCLSVGMSKEAIKTGRYTHQKRTNDTREIQGLRGTPPSSTTSSPAPTPGHASPSAALLTPEQSPTGGIIASTARAPSPVHGALSENLLAAFDECFPDLAAHFQHPEHIQQLVEGLLPTEGSMSNRVYTNTPDDVIIRTVNTEIGVLASLNCTTLGCDNMILQDCPVTSTVFEDTEEHSSTRATMSDAFASSEVVGDWVELGRDGGCYHGDSPNSHLGTGDSPNSHLGTGDSPNSHLGNDGSKSSGGNVAYYPVHLIEIWTKHMEEAVRGLVKFAKRIPGFSQLSMSDQITLIKAARGEASVLLKYKNLDQERQIVIDYRRDTDTIHLYPFTFLRRLFITAGCVLLSHHELCRRYHKYSLRQQDVALMLALIIASPDRENLSDVAQVERIQETVLLELSGELSMSHGRRALPRLLLTLPQLRTHSHLQHKHLEEVQSRYHIDFPPLLKEVLLR